MKLPTWNKVQRRRKIHISYTDPDFVEYYDIDLDDFTKLVVKLRNKERLTEAENDRYGLYILTVALIVQENKKFKNKTLTEKEEMIEQQYMELLQGLPTFNPNKGCSIYSYAYRIGYTSACHYFTFKIDEAEEWKAIEEHCKQELEDYYYEWSDHKVRNINIKEIR